MTDRRTLLKTVAAFGGASQATPQPKESDRDYWLALLKRLAEPVLTNLAKRTLKKNMPVECAAGDEQDRRRFTHLEALGRLLAGIAPWLETNEQFAGLAREAIRSATDPKSPDYLNFNDGDQPVVDCGFLSQALLRAPNALWKKLDTTTQKNLVAALVSSRVITPHFSNWLLFSAMVEVALAMMGERWDGMRVDYALRKHNEWYVGDGVYADGPQYHWDYYNSYVMQPMLIDALRNIAPHSNRWEKLLPDVMTRARRYAAIQERLIAPDGSFPAVGRSITYRTGAFHLLAQMALMRESAQVRTALTAVIRRTMEAPGTFDDNGWLRIGLCGHQAHLAERYISTGSLYLCSTVLLPLGLPATDPFWANPAQDWTSKRIWSGQDHAADHAI